MNAPRVNSTAYRTSSLRLRMWSAGWLVPFLLTAVLRPGVAGTGERFVLPPGPTMLTSGLKLEVSSFWVQSSGYRPVDITVTCLSRALGDRTLAVRLFPNSWGRSYWNECVECTIEIPQGSKSVQHQVSVPQSSEWNQLRIEVYEEGKLLTDVSPEYGMSFRQSGGYYGWTEVYPAVLFIDADAPDPAARAQLVAQWQATGKPTAQLPDVRALSHLFEFDANGARFGPQLAVDFASTQSHLADSEILTIVHNLPTVELYPPGALPEHWVNYTPFSLIVISMTDLQDLARRWPERWKGLRNYVATGGNLIVCGMGDRFDRLAGLDRLLNRPSDASDVAARWTRPTADKYRVGLNLIVGERAGYAQSFESESQGTVEAVEGILGAEDVGEDGDPDRVAARREPPPDPLFQLSAYQMGRVVAMQPDDPFDVPRSQWDWLLASLGEDRWMWYRRQGLSMTRENHSFWEFLIPGVGAAPVGFFLITITAFMVVVGPINYWLLARRRRLQLLMFTVPAAALVVTVALLVYALVDDGLGVRTRLRSFTLVGRGPGVPTVSWSRQSYYAGLAPSAGLVFPEQAAIFPMRYEYGGPRGTGRTVLRWAPDRQQLADGFLRSRSTAQFVVVSAQNAGNSGVAVHHKEGRPTEVENRLGAPADVIVVFDGSDAAHVVRHVPAGSVAPLRRIPSDEARSELLRLRGDALPQLPVGLDSPRSLRPFYGSTYYYYGRGSDQTFGPPTTSTSLMERAIEQLGEPPAGYQRFYVAVTTKAPAAVPVGVPKAKQEAGFHVICGPW